MAFCRPFRWCAATALLAVSLLGTANAEPIPAPNRDAPQAGVVHMASRSPMFPSLRPIPRDPWAAPVLAWDGHPEDSNWTQAAIAALRGPGAALVDVTPRDIASWCPGYAQAGEGQRRAFWAGLISVLAYHESTHRAAAVGGGGRWFGLVQISPATARGRGCRAQTGDALLDGVSNLTCGLRIMGATVARDGVIAQGMRGVAADWGPFHSTRKRESMRSWLRDQPFCRPDLAASPRPLLRPAH